MVQTAKVTKLLEDGRSEVAVKRQSACGPRLFQMRRRMQRADGQFHGGCRRGKSGPAMPGDRVTVESSTGGVLKAGRPGVSGALCALLSGLLSDRSTGDDRGCQRGLRRHRFCRRRGIGHFTGPACAKTPRHLLPDHCDRACRLMFGYVRPNREELKVREQRDYDALYCGLCQAWGRATVFGPECS